jgi:hypothetical protein
LLGNGFLLVLPVLVWDVLLTTKLPAATTHPSGN